MKRASIIFATAILGFSLCGCAETLDEIGKNGGHTNVDVEANDISTNTVTDRLLT